MVAPDEVRVTFNGEFIEHFPAYKAALEKQFTDIARQVVKAKLDRGEYDK